MISTHNSKKIKINCRAIVSTPGRSGCVKIAQEIGMLDCQALDHVAYHWFMVRQKIVHSRYHKQIVNWYSISKTLLQFHIMFRILSPGGVKQQVVLIRESSINLPLYTG